MSHSKQNEVAAQWATRGAAKSGKASALSFAGNSIYSYDARIAYLRRHKGELTAFVTTKKYSSTTSSHTSTAFCAARNAGLPIVRKNF